MAEGPDPIAREKHLEELEKEITCAVCHGHYERAKLLPCNHYYCEACIEVLAKRAKGEPINCPECRKETSLPAGGMAELPGAFFVERMKDLYGKMAKVEGKVEALCEQCAGGKSVAFCRQCAEFICGDCERSHMRMKTFVGHVVASLGDLKVGGVKNILLKTAPPLECLEHHEPIKMFCFDCNRLICSDCTFIDHSEHKFEFLKKCAPESRKTLRDCLAPLQKMRTDIAGAEKTLVTEHARVDAQEKEVCRSIDESFEAMKAVLDQRKTEVVKKACKLAREKKDSLSAQREVFQAAKKEIQTLTEVVERNIESTSDQDLMNIHTQLETKMKEEEKRHRQISLEPATTADITCNLPSPDVIPKHLGSVYDPSTPCILHRNINDVISAEVGSPEQVSVAAPTASLADVSADLKSVVKPSSSVNCRVIQNGVGVYSISVTPQVRGRHELIMRVKNKEITGSPLSILAKISPRQLGQDVREIVGLNHPWGIAVNNKQQIVTAECGSNTITVMEKDGKKVQTIECTEFQDIRGVATAADGAVYVTDIGAHCLFKFNSQGNLLKTVCNEFQKPISVKVIRNQLYIIDRDSSLVKILDMDCNVVGAMAIQINHPRDIAEGPDGLLYVAGEGKISVYSHDGVFIHHLVLQPLKLSKFWGICFNSAGLIIASDCDYGVYVFKPCGECVAHVASAGVPAGVTVDEDGFVYVCLFIHRGKVIVL